MKVFVVAPGEYSDYHIKAIFSTRELASEFIAEYNRLVTDKWTKIDGFPIEEWDVDEYTARPLGCWQVDIEENGAVRRKGWDLEHDPHAPPTVHDGYMTSGAGFVPRHFIGYGKTVEHARRSAEELRRQTLILEGEGK